jgi:hypothetical protein
MRFGIREICEVVLKAKATQKVGNKMFYKNEPVIYFDTLKTSSLEGAASTVYANGGRGNSRLVAWEGERTLTFTMEDALISPAGLMILTGAGLIEPTAEKTIKVHTTEQTDKFKFTKTGETITGVDIVLDQKPYVDLESEKHEDYIYVMGMVEGEVTTEPFIPDHTTAGVPVVYNEEQKWYVAATEDQTPDGYMISLIVDGGIEGAKPERASGFDEVDLLAGIDVVLVDYYVEKTSAGEVMQIEITPDKFGGNYYLEASTLFRDTSGVDMPAEFIIPNCKIQSNFTFSMASSGDPSTFTFTMDAFPDYTRFDKTKKVLATIQVVQTGNAQAIASRTRTMHDPDHEKFFV